MIVDHEEVDQWRRAHPTWGTPAPFLPQSPDFPRLHPRQLSVQLLRTVIEVRRKARTLPIEVVDLLRQLREVLDRRLLLRRALSGVTDEEQLELHAGIPVVCGGRSMLLRDLAELVEALEAGKHGSKKGDNAARERQPEARMGLVVCEDSRRNNRRSKHCQPTGDLVEPGTPVRPVVVHRADKVGIVKVVLRLLAELSQFGVGVRHFSDVTPRAGLRLSSRSRTARRASSNTRASRKSWNCAFADCANASS